MLLRQRQGQCKSKVILLHSLFKKEAILDNFLLSSVIPQLGSRIELAAHSELLEPWKWRLTTHFAHVVNAIPPSKLPKTSKCTCFSIMEECLMFATSVATQATTPLIWKNIWWFTAERSPLFAHNATLAAKMVVASKYTIWPIQEKNPLVAHSAAIPSQELQTSRGTCLSIQEKSLSSASSVTTHAEILIPSRDTFWHILERSPSAACNVTSLA